MKCKYFLSLAALAVFTMNVQGAEPTDAAKVPHKVENVTVEDLSSNKITLPHWGEKNLIIFYMDPDKHNQNSDFQDEFEKKGVGSTGNLFSFGVVNTHDGTWPTSLVRTFARKRTAKNGGIALLDDDGILATKWDLGNCNDKFVLIVVSKEGELVFLRKGELTAEDKAEFYKVVEKYK